MTGNPAIKVQSLEGQAAVLEQQAAESEATAVHRMSPRSLSYWRVLQRVDERRSQARELRRQASQLRLSAA